MTDNETETITITVTWESTHQIEVPAGWRPTDRLDDFPPGVLNEVTPDTAELVDWR